MHINTEIIDNCVVITEIISNDDIITIPAEIDGKKVLGISSNAFEKCLNLEELILPDDIKELPPNLLFGKKLYSIKLPKNIKKLYSNSIDFDEAFISNVLNIDTNLYNKLLYEEANELFNSNYEIHIIHNKAVEAFIPFEDKYICGACYLYKGELKFKTYGENKDLTKYSLFSLLFLNKILKKNEETGSHSNDCLFDESYKANFDPDNIRIINSILQTSDIKNIRMNCRIDYIDNDIAIVYDKKTDMKYIAHYETNIMGYMYGIGKKCSCGNCDCIHIKAAHYYLKTNYYKKIIGPEIGSKFVEIIDKKPIKYNYNYLSLLFGEKYFSYLSNKEISTWQLPKYIASNYDIDRIDLSKYDISLMNDALKYQCIDNKSEEHFYYHTNGIEGTIYGILVDHDKEKKSRIIFARKGNDISYECFCKSDKTTVCVHCMAVIMHFKGADYYTNFKNKNIKIDETNFQKNSILSDFLNAFINDLVLNTITNKSDREKAINDSNPNYISSEIIKINSAFEDYDNTTVEIIDYNTIEIRNSHEKATFSNKADKYNGYKLVLEKNGKIRESYTSIDHKYLMIVQDKLGPFKDYYYNLFNDIRPLINLRATLDKRIANLDFNEVYPILERKQIDVIFNEYSFDGVILSHINNLLINRKK